ncbi:MAG: 3D domain-containing protein [Trueperaceae bacterium]|nr:MAG: 3D domain-containing protein [Trueperaceae bacterium]
MDFHISGKLIVIGIVLSALITAFSTETPDPLFPLEVSPGVEVLADPHRSVETPHVKVAGPSAMPTFVLLATGYNSHASQTDSTPHITSTGAQTEFGIIAVSRDLLGSDLPYGSLVRIKDLGNYHNGHGEGHFQHLLDQQDVFVVEDTMHRRKRQQVDIWFPDYKSAMTWGVRRVEVELVRYGRDGVTFGNTPPSDLNTTTLLASIGRP